MQHNIVEANWLSDRVCFLITRPSCLQPFEGGQYVIFNLPGPLNLPFSIANTFDAQENGGCMHFYIRFDARDEALNVLRDLIERGEALDISIPRGECIYRNMSVPRVIFFVQGTGIAQAKSILDTAQRQGDRRKHDLFWLSSSVLKAEFMRVARYPDMEYHQYDVPANFPDAFQILKQEALCAVDKNFADCMIYLTGAWPFVDAIMPFLLEHAAKRSLIYSDRFAFM